MAELTLKVKKAFVMLNGKLVKVYIEIPEGAKPIATEEKDLLFNKNNEGVYQ